jgi:hypothetical protein
MPSPEALAFGAQVADALARTLGKDLVGAYFVGSVALGGYVPGESDIDVAAVSSAALTDPQRQSVASAIVEVSAACPARGLEFTLGRREVVSSPPVGAGWAPRIQAYEAVRPLSDEERSLLPVFRKPESPVRPGGISWRCERHGARTRTSEMSSRSGRRSGCRSCSAGEWR